MADNYCDELLDAALFGDALERNMRVTRYLQELSFVAPEQLNRRGAEIVEQLLDIVTSNAFPSMGGPLPDGVRMESPQIMPTRRGRVAQLCERLSEDEERAFYALAVLFDPDLSRNVVDRIWDR